MTTRPRTHPPDGDPSRIVVGVDSSAAGRAALDAAARLAHDSARPLHLVRVWREVDWFLSAPPAAVAALGGQEDDDRRALVAQHRRARDLAPDVPVSSEFTPGSLFDVLIERCAATDLLVLGAPADADPADRGPGPVGAWFIAHAPCAVRIVSADGAQLDAPLPMAR